MPPPRGGGDAEGVAIGRVRVQFLGSGGPFASGRRLQSCILLEGESGRCLLDCGMTSLLAMARYGIDPGAIDAILVTHFHGDHIGGLSLMILELSMRDRQGIVDPPRTRPLVIAGPDGIEGRVRAALDLFEWRDALDTVQRAGLVEFVTLMPGSEARIGPLTAMVYAARHTPEALTLRVALDGVTIAYSGDTAWTDALVQASAGANLFICQVFTVDLPQAGMINLRTFEQHRGELTCRRIILTHIGAQMQARLDEVAETVAEDGMIIEIQTGGGTRGHA